MRVLVPLALAASAIVALNLRGQDSPLVLANQAVAPMDSRDDLRLLINEFQGAYPDTPQQRISKKGNRGPKEVQFRKKGGKWGAVAGIPLLLAQPMVKRAGKEIGAAYGRRQDRKNAKNEMERLTGGASTSSSKK
ncbi:hypothetical protein LEN26_017778 [Aphanomyces euteiches]|nr:hypothetical protein LEN26_017778 [Aphanomyces euteiches]KAH9117105.1 hypothetical protein AeMF1_009026 [Aphanomyces euteiches]KAH9183844.1 hypothetical protein AeNC1_014180 [Aphanomyces euteiches]